MPTALLLCAALAAAPAPDAHQLAARVQAAYERTRDLEARFVQTYSYAAFGRSQVSRGELRVKKPGKMRWDYESPAKKTVAVSGSRLVQYEPEANQAYVDERFDATAMSAAVAFLLGKGSLEKEFEPSLGEGGELVLTPRQPDGRVARIALVVDAAGDVAATRVVDGSGNVNEVRFEGLRRNVGLKDSEFELRLPKDVRRIAAPGR
ncbi:MAG TPA: outer membrane lipoprotein carrier protein LolA [Anaeromyxobacteraceae bacterium]|jgi:outer membrane lipoprotein carrier protein|nr:outer membrane lipoprotein carrier protein LolA [Anaeromyxobacteraceae bacterium]